LGKRTIENQATTITNFRLKTAGLVGGISPESTIDYYRQIIDAYRHRSDADNYPQIIINSINLRRMVDMFEASDLAGVVKYLLEAIERLAGAGADFAAIAANTPHIVFDELRERSPLPLISIVEATCAEAERRRCKRVGLFGTRFTMQARFYPEVMARAGIAVVVPNDDEQHYIHSRYMGELIQGQFLPETKRRLLEIVDELKARSGIDAVILGGTELPLILRDEEHHGVPFFDTTKIHVARIVDELAK
jgi:aspartate racemase